MQPCQLILRNNSYWWRVYKPTSLVHFQIFYYFELVSMGVHCVQRPASIKIQNKPSFGAIKVTFPINRKTLNRTNNNHTQKISPSQLRHLKQYSHRYRINTLINVFRWHSVRPVILQLFSVNCTNWLMESVTKPTQHLLAASHGAKHPSTTFKCVDQCI